MSALNEVILPKCPTCGSPLGEHWRGRPCLETPPAPEPQMTHTEQRAKLAQLKAVCDAATAGPWKALWVVHGMPAKPCKFGLVAEETGLETGRMWEREDAVFMEQAANELPALIEAHEKALDEIADLQASADLRHKADERAIRQWQAAHPGNDDRWPDHADLCCWLMEQVELHKVADTISVPAEELAGAIRHMRDVVASRDAEIERLREAMRVGCRIMDWPEDGSWLVHARDSKAEIERLKAAGKTILAWLKQSPGVTSQEAKQARRVFEEGE